MRNRGGSALAMAVVMAGLITLGTVATGLTAAVTTYTVTFLEVGLVLGTPWSVNFGGILYPSTTGSITITGVGAGSSYWYPTTPVAGTTGVQYVATTAAAYMSVPNQVRQVVVFQKQYSVTMANAPSGYGGTTPTAGTAWYNAGSLLPISAWHYPGYAFTTWTSSPTSITFSNALSSATTATIGASGTITADFKALLYYGNFTETGLPTSVTWSVTFGGLTHFSGSAIDSTGKHVPGGYSWSVAIVSSGTLAQYVPSPASGYMTLPYQTTQTIVFVKQLSVAFAVTGSGYTTPSSTTFYNNGSDFTISAISSSVTSVFSGWGYGGAKFFLGSKSSASTNVTIRSSGTLTAKFVTGTPCTVCTVKFSEVGLPPGTTWGVTFAGIYYTSSTATISIAGVTSAASWAADSPISTGTWGEQFIAPLGSGYMYVPSQIVQMVVYVEQYLVNFVSTPTYAGAVNPASGYFTAGMNLAIWAVNTDTLKFHLWTSNNTTNLVIATPTGASTFVALSGPGTITAVFVPILYKISFLAIGLPSGTAWVVVFGGTTYHSTGTMLNVSGVPSGYYSWSDYGLYSGGSAGVVYAAWNTYGSGYIYQQTFWAILFVKEYKVTIAAGGVAGGSVIPVGTAYYVAGTIVAVSAVNATSSHFSGWSSSAGSIGIGAPSKNATTISIGGTGTVTATFV